MGSGEATSRDKADVSVLLRDKHKDDHALPPAVGARA